jgi:DNA polymerase I-like protein with 3'-5' exonuclease and polymerase domains
MRMLEQCGIVVNGEIHDVLMMCHALSPVEFSYELKYLAKKYGDIDVEDRKGLMDAVRKVRLAVVNARKRINAGKVKDGDRLLASYAINEKAEDFYTGEIVKDAKAARADMWLAPMPIRKKYGETDGLRTAVLFESCRAAMDEDAENNGKMWEIYRMEQKLRPIIKKMEDRGLRIDAEERDSLAKMYHGLMEKHAGEALPYVKVREDWHIGSVQSQQREFLVNQGLKPLEWVIDKKTKQPTRCPHCKGAKCSVCHQTGHNAKIDNDFLAKYGSKRDENDQLVPTHQLCWHVLHYKAASAMLGFLKSYKELCVKDVEAAIEILHPNLNQTGTQTGRMSAERRFGEEEVDGSVPHPKRVRSETWVRIPRT